jgi:hypothetical protein
MGWPTWSAFLVSAVAPRQHPVTALLPLYHAPASVAQCQARQSGPPWALPTPAHKRPHCPLCSTVLNNRKFFPPPSCIIEGEAGAPPSIVSSWVFFVADGPDHAPNRPVQRATPPNRRSVASAPQLPPSSESLPPASYSECSSWKWPPRATPLASGAADSTTRHRQPLAGWAAATVRWLLVPSYARAKKMALSH